MKVASYALTLALLLSGCAGETTEVIETTGADAGDGEFPVVGSFEIVDEAAFSQILDPDAEIVQLTTGHQFVEGPVWIPDDGGYLVFSDIPANELKRWDAVGGARTFRAPSNSANGNTLDLEGRLITAQHDGHVTRTEANGTVVNIAERYDGAHLSSPNDVVVKSDGTIWFTDPNYGLGEREQETPGNYVYRLDPISQVVTAVVTDMEMPNGLCFAPDESLLYVADAGSPSHIRSFGVAPDGATAGGEVLATIDQGFPDGIRCDALGNVWSSSGDGAQIFSDTGDLIGRILLPEGAANLAFGGPDGTTVYFTARTSVYSLPTRVRDGAMR